MFETHVPFCSLVEVDADKTPQSIVYDRGSNCYKLDNWEKIGLINVDYVEYLQLRAGKYQHTISKFNAVTGSKEEKLVFSINTGLETTPTTNNIEIGVYRASSRNELPYGVFRFSYSRHEIVIRPFPFDNSEPKLVANSHDLVAEVNNFFSNPSSNRKHKKGILLYGPPGCGKTTDIYKLRKLTETNKYRVFFVDEDVRMGGLLDYKSILAEENTIFVFEEITERMDRNGVKDLLTFLDGENSWNNSIAIATTNYPEQMPANLVDRPGRFDTFLEYKLPTEDQIKTLAEAFGSVSGYECLYKKGLSFDYISYIIDKSLKLNKTIQETLTFERDRKSRLSETFKGKIGLGD